MVLVVLLVGVPRYTQLEGESGLAAAEPPVVLSPPLEFLDGLFEPNATLSTMLEVYDIGPEVAYEVAAAIEPVFSLRRFRAGHEFRVVREEGGALVAFEYGIDDESRLRVVRTADAFSARIDALPLETRVETVTAAVRDSLWGALASAPKGDALVMVLADIFDAQVDFYRDIRPADEIRFVIEKKYYRDDFVKYGVVYAAEFVNRGQALEAYRFGDEYYDENGMSTRRSFLPAPLEFTRISSGFSNARLHPILNTVRAHRGVDFAAPTGTPVRAAADGTVSFAGVNGGFGNLVTIRHPRDSRGDTVSTDYAHLSRIDVRSGQRVKQGDTIGRVGMTGTATGPHLHYQMSVNGQIIDPRTRRADPPEPIDPSLREEYLASIVELRETLQTLAIPYDSASLAE
jgi:murein DD-endopeptidase MepM/ murein hydrolase activator NlpD